MSQHSFHSLSAAHLKSDSLDEEKVIHSQTIASLKSASEVLKRKSASSSFDSHAEDRGKDSLKLRISRSESATSQAASSTATSSKLKSIAFFWMRSAKPSDTLSAVFKSSSPGKSAGLDRRSFGGIPENNTVLSVDDIKQRWRRQQIANKEISNKEMFCKGQRTFWSVWLLRR